MPRNALIPPRYQTVMPYLIVKDAAKFIDFTQKVFGATETYRAKRDENTLMHAEIMIGDSTIMFADSTDKYPPRPAGLFVYVLDVDGTYQSALDEGAKVVTPVAEQEYGRSGGVEDPFGNTWWITGIK